MQRGPLRLVNVRNVEEKNTVKRNWCLLVAGRFWVTLLTGQCRGTVPLRSSYLAGDFTKDTDAQQAVTSKLQTLDNDFVCAGLETLVLWCDKCLNVNGGYAEV